VHLVFISHTGADERAATLAASLQSKLFGQQIVAFYDRRTLQEGHAWRNRICHAAMCCKVFIAIISEKYLRKRCENGSTNWRPWTLLELHLALRHNTRTGRAVLLPVLLDVNRDALKAAADELQRLPSDQVIAHAVMPGSKQQMHLTGAIAAAGIRVLEADPQGDRLSRYPDKSGADDLSTAVAAHCSRMCCPLSA
jgi:hypothetical protein